MDDPTIGVEVCMVCRDLAHAPRFLLPAGYTLRSFREGDVATWVRIQRACADDLAFITAENFYAEMPGDSEYLSQRVLFLVDPSGSDIGSITAWNDAELDGRDMGRIHWVAIVAEAQGRGLSKPMMSAACDVLRKLGYTEAYLVTYTGLVPAINLYLAFGYRPHPRNEAEREAWHAVAPHLKMPIEV